jgi:hypothetical protein
MSVRDAMPDYVKKVYREVELEQEINGGAFLDLKAINKMLTPRAVQIGTVGSEILGVKKKKVVDDDVIDEVNFQSVLVEKAVEDAVRKARMLTEKKDVIKMLPKKPDANDVIVDVIHGRVKCYDAVRRLIENAES